MTFIRVPKTPHPLYIYIFILTLIARFVIAYVWHGLMSQR